MRNNNVSSDVVDIAIEPSCGMERVGAYLFMNQAARDNALKVLSSTNINVDCKALTFRAGTLPNPLLETHRSHGNDVRKVYFSSLGDTISDSEVALALHIKGTKHQQEFGRLPKVEQEFSSPFKSNTKEPFQCVICSSSSRFKTKHAVTTHIGTETHRQNNVVVLLSIARAEVKFHRDEHKCLVCDVTVRSFKDYVAHCNLPTHTSKLETCIEPCPAFNEPSGCKDSSCPFKHVAIGPPKKPESSETTIKSVNGAGPNNHGPASSLFLNNPPRRSGGFRGRGGAQIRGAGFPSRRGGVFR